MATARQFAAVGNVAEAIALYEKARHTDSRVEAAATRRLAVLYDKQGQFDKARVEYEKVLQKNPNDADTLNNLGYGYYSRGQWEQAEQYLRKAVTANPRHEHAWVNLGMTLAQQQRYEQSLEAFARVLPPAETQCNLAFILTTQGKREQAKQAYAEALRLEPGLQLAQAALAKLHESESTNAAAADDRHAPVLRFVADSEPPGAADYDSPVFIDSEAVAPGAPPRVQ
jgi:tetratricopeptide (TPR) repeat protein